MYFFEKLFSGVLHVTKSESEVKIFKFDGEREIKKMFHHHDFQKSKIFVPDLDWAAQKPHKINYQNFGCKKKLMPERVELFW